MNEKKSSVKKVLGFVVPIFIIISAMLVVVARKSQCPRPDEQTPYYRSFPVMGTFAEVALYGDEKNANKALDKVYDVLTEVDKVCSRFDPDSELSRLNASAAKTPFKCSNLLWDVLQKSKYFYDLSDGSFDVTVTPLMKLWGFFRKQDKIPTDRQIKETLSLVGFNNIVLNSRDKSVYFKKPEIEIDLGGIAKGYAVDLAYDAIKKYNIKRGVINLAGNMRFLPLPSPGKKYYTAGIRDPFDKTKLMKGSLNLLDRSLATSGDYEQYIILNGKRFTHIINPKTGYPIKDMAAVTIVSRSALWCDALSTSVFLKGKAFAEKIHRDFSDIDILIVKGYHDQPKTIKVYKFGDTLKPVHF